MAFRTYLKAALSISIFLAAIGGEAASQPTQATNPNPADGAIDVSVEANLTWVRGDGADEEEVYFGTDPCALPKVADITDLETNPPLYNPGDPNLVASTTYYWQIVEVNGLDRYEGPVWEFTTVRGEAQPEYPGDGALIKGDVLGGGNISTNLEFIPGATTVEYKGYFSEDYSKVANRDSDASLGPPPFPDYDEHMFWVGNPYVAPANDTLVRGTKYYWTVDSNDAKGNTFYGDIWEFCIQSFKAFEPSPPNEAILVGWVRNVLLSWLPGFGVEEHDIYMGTSWEDVNNAVYDFYNPPPEFVATRSEPNYHIYDLFDDTKYYWRVDQVIGRMHPSIGGGTYHKGDVWCFTILPHIHPDYNLVGWWKFDMGVGNIAFDWSGYDNHGTLMGDPQWVTDGKIDGAMDFDGSGDYIWTGRSASDLGIAGSHAKTATACVFTREFNNGGIWDLGAHSDSQDFCLRTLDTDNQWRVQYGGGADHDFTYDSLNKWVHFALVFEPPSHSICYADGFVISEVNDAALNTSNANPFQIGCYGWQNDYFNGLIDDLRLYDYALSAEEVRMFGAPPEAWRPRPYDGQVSVPVTVTLQWMPGRHAAQHDVYFGTNFDDVNNAVFDPFNPPPVFLDTVSEPNILVTPLAFNTKYYWRVDEVVGRSPPDFIPAAFYKGDVWCFTTVSRCIYVDIDAAGANNGTSWENAYNFLQDALIEAGSVLKPVEIRVAEGIHTPDSNSSDPNGSGDRMATFKLINGVTLKGGYAGYGEANPDARDIKLYETILSGDLNGNDVDVNDPCDLLSEPTRAENSYHVVTGDRQGWPNAKVVVDGFTITAGNANGDYPGGERTGGGMHFCSGKIINCTIIGNSAIWGGGMCYIVGEIINCNIKRNFVSGRGGGMSYSDVLMTNCTISENSAVQGGGGINNTAGDMMLTNCIFIRNSARMGGAMWYIDGKFGIQTLVNCTFFGNLTEVGGGAIYLDYSSPTLRNCTLWGDVPDEIYGDIPTVTYSNIQGSYPGNGNINADPCFVDAAGGDLRLSSDSPCIDAGYNNAPNLPATDLDGHPRIIDGDCNDTEVVDMGAYEFNYAYMGDFDYNCTVDFVDLSIFGLAWASQPGDFNWDFAYDISIPADNVIDRLDLAAFADNWLAGIK